MDDNNARFSVGPRNGAPLANAKLGDDYYLIDQLGASFYLLFFTDGSAVPADLQAEVQAIRSRGIPLQIVAFSFPGSQ